MFLDDHKVLVMECVSIVEKTVERSLLYMKVSFLSFQ
jgi:hypothetical protein